MGNELDDLNNYQDDDTKRAQLLLPSFSPGAQPGSQQGTAQPSSSPPVYNYPPPRPAAPSVVAPDGPKSWKDYVSAGLAGQLRASKAAEDTVSNLAGQPDESAATQQLEAKRAKDATPIDSTQDQYKPSFGQKVIRGLDAVRRGGVLGLADPADVGGQAYGAPNIQYTRDRAAQTANVASDDQQIQNARDNFKAASDRAKALATEQRAVATGYKDVGTAGTEQEAQEEAGRHNVADEGNTAQKNANEAKYQKGELGIRGGELALARQKEKFDEQDGNSPKNSAALDRETKQFAASWEKDVTTANAQLEKIADARAMVNGSAEAQALGIPKVLTALVGGQGTGVKITTPELNAIGKARGLTGDVEGTLNQWSGKGKLTAEQKKQLTGILDDVKERIIKKQAISSATLDGIYNAKNRDDIIAAHQAGRKKLNNYEAGNPDVPDGQMGVRLKDGRTGHIDPKQRDAFMHDNPGATTF